MAKWDESDPEAVLFSRGPNAVCGGWVKVPVGAIVRVDVLGSSTCKEHRHPYVRLHLDLRAGDARHAAVLAALRETPPAAPGRTIPRRTPRSCSSDGRLCYDCFDANGQCICNWFYDGSYFATTDCGTSP
ncbi:hypothetical protein [Nannocystis punicea]|uniref:Uncharacterized protein n=1 Tax=Nannocystis punicea TaxID=2995304 RepID=A0ABY7HIZ7_9BACT|nr:hypothetical protein [Nannocystis poenicansa]WAS99315.1 hypothetical protein O0S08_24570 [Nannocystis poenicansa]